MKIQEFVYAYQLVPFDSKNRNQAILLSQRLQEDGSTLWMVHHNGNNNSSLCSDGLFCLEPARSEITQEFFKRYRYKTIEEACRAFKTHLEIQKDPSHELYFLYRHFDYEFMETEFNKFLLAAEIKL